MTDFPRKFTDAEGLLWFEVVDGSFRTVHEDGSYRQEPNVASLDLWWGPLQAVSRG